MSQFCSRLRYHFPQRCTGYSWQSVSPFAANWIGHCSHLSLQRGPGRVQRPPLLIRHWPFDNNPDHSITYNLF